MAFSRMFPLFGVAIAPGMLVGCCCCCMLVASDSRWSVLVDICWWWFVWCSAALVEAFRLIAVKLPADVPGRLTAEVGECSSVELVDGIDMLILLAIIIAELRFFTWGPAAPPTMAIACVPVFELEAMALSKSNVVCG